MTHFDAFVLQVELDMRWEFVLDSSFVLRGTKKVARTVGHLTPASDRKLGRVSRKAFS